MQNKPLDQTWNNIETIIVYGIGLVASRFIDRILQDFKVPYIIDNNKQGMEYHNIPIVGYESVKKNILCEKRKIVVMTSQRVYCDIQKILEADGLRDTEDFCRIEQFIVEWYWENKNLINIIQVNTAVTTWCTLNCEKCNMFMPHYEKHMRKHYTFAEMKEDIDLLLNYVDYIFWYNFLGGEPFLNKELKDIVAYVGERYSDKVGKLGVTTNGTIIPSEETLIQLKKYNVTVSISDYTENVSYIEKIEKLIKKLDEWKIPYMKNHMTEWKDFGFPQTPFHWGENNAYSHMKSCSPLFHGVNDKKLYYCHVVWSAEKAGLYSVPEQDYIDLTKQDFGNYEDRRKISKYCAGECERGFLEFCMLCGGCGADNMRTISAGIQKDVNTI